MNEVFESVQPSGLRRPGLVSSPAALEVGVEAGRGRFGAVDMARQVLAFARTGRNHADDGIAEIKLDLARAWQALRRLDAVGSLTIAAQIERQAGQLSKAAGDTVRCEVAAVRAAALVLRDDPAAALPAALSALRLAADAPIAHVALTVCRSVYWRLGDLDSFYAVERRPLGDRPVRLRAITAMFDLALDAAVELGRMRFGAARLLAEDALDVASRYVAGQTAMTAFPVCIIAQVLYEQGQLNEAESMIEARLPDIAKGGTIEGAVRAYSVLARIAATRQQSARALVMLGEADALGAQRGWPRLRAASLAQQIELHVASGCIEGARQALHQLSQLVDRRGGASCNERFEMSRFEVVAKARLALADCPATVDVAALRRVHCDTVLRRDLYAAMPVALLLIEALLAVGHRDEAVAALVELLKLAAETGVHRTLVDCSAPVAQLIDDIVHRTIVPGDDIRELLPYASMLLGRRRRACGDAQRAIDPQRVAACAGLSERERAIVRLMGRGLTNKQIAIDLSIAPETVKTHAKHLYTKLAVKNRTEAVTLAARLGLIQMNHHLAWDPTSQR